MKRYNKELLNHIYKICERDGAITQVNPEYYEWFLAISEKGMEILIECIIRDRLENINEKILNDKWKSDEEMFGYITDFLEMIAIGLMGVREKDLKIVFRKPVGDPPDKDMERKLDKKIEKAVPIIKKVLIKWACKRPWTGSR